MKIGLAVRVNRKKKGFSQMKLSEKSGYSQKHISYVESGKSIPTLKFIYTISKALKISMTQFFWNSVEEKEFNGIRKSNYLILKKNIDKIFEEIFEK
jgi:transcriptional regulator with XRE-family HTH domain